MENETTIKKVLTTEVKYIIGIVVFVVGVVAPYYQIRQDIAIIKENHMAHLEKQSLEIRGLNDRYNELKEVSNKQQTEIIELMKIIAKIE